MSDESKVGTEGGEPAAEETKGKGKAKGKAKAKKVKEPKPPKEKKVKAPKPAKEKKDGVISTILSAMQQDGGATAKEILEVLKLKFPEKNDGMMTTIRIQVSRLPERCGFELKKTKVEGRGLVYKAPKSAKLTPAAKKEKLPATEGEAATE